MVNVAYKVLRPNLMNLGLRGCGLMQYKKRGWNHPLEPLERGKGPGGLWVAKRIDKARWLARYFRDHFFEDVVIWRCEIEDVLYAHPNTGRSKTAKLKLLNLVAKYEYRDQASHEKSNRIYKGMGTKGVKGFSWL